MSDHSGGRIESTVAVIPIAAVKDALLLIHKESKAEIKRRCSELLIAVREPGTNGHKFSQGELIYRLISHQLDAHKHDINVAFNVRTDLLSTPRANHGRRLALSPAPLTRRCRCNVSRATRTTQTELQAVDVPTQTEITEKTHRQTQTARLTCSAGQACPISMQIAPYDTPPPRKKPRIEDEDTTSALISPVSGPPPVSERAVKVPKKSTTSKNGLSLWTKQKKEATAQKRKRRSKGWANNAKKGSRGAADRTREPRPAEQLETEFRAKLKEDGETALKVLAPYIDEKLPWDNVTDKHGKVCIHSYSRFILF